MHMDNLTGLPETLCANLRALSGLRAMRHDMVNEGRTVLNNHGLSAHADIQRNF